MATNVISQTDMKTAKKDQLLRKMRSSARLSFAICRVTFVATFLAVTAKAAVVYRVLPAEASLIKTELSTNFKVEAPL